MMVAKPKKKKNEDDRSRVFFPFHLYLTFLLFLLTFSPIPIVRKTSPPSPP